MPSPCSLTPRLDATKAGKACANGEKYRLQKRSQRLDMRPEHDANTHHGARRKFILALYTIKKTSGQS